MTRATGEDINVEGALFRGGRSSFLLGLLVAPLLDVADLLADLNS